MYMTIEVDHAIKGGMEEEALQILKELNNRGLDYAGEGPSAPGLLLPDARTGLEVADSYREHMDKLFSRVRRVTNNQARIRVRVRT